MYIDLGAAKGVISIHAPLTGSDHRLGRTTPIRAGFQSTLPLRGATKDSQIGAYADLISIHAPLTGSDL